MVIASLTPEEGLTEGQSVELSFTPESSAGTAIVLSTMVVKYKNGSTTTTLDIDDFEEDEGTYSTKWTVGAGLTLIEATLTGTADGETIVVTGKAKISAEPLNL